MKEEYRYITKIERNLNIYKQKIFKNENLTDNESMILHYVRHHEGCSQDEIRRYFEIDKALVARNVKKLIEKELLIKKNNNEDNRISNLYATDKTNSLKNNLIDIENKYYEYLFSDIDEEEKNQFFNTLAKIYDKSKKHRKSGFNEIK